MIIRRRTISNTRPRSEQTCRFHRKGFFILLLLVGAIVSVACTNGDGVSSPATTPAQTSVPTPDIEAIAERVVLKTLETIPTATPVPTPDIEAIVEPIVRQTLETLPTASTETPEPTAMRATVSPAATALTTPTPPSVPAEPSPDPPQRVEAVGVRAAPVPVPVRSALVPGGGASLLPVAPELSEAGGLTVTARGSVKVAADEAYVIVIPEQFYGPTGPVPLSSEDRADVVQNLMGIGIEEADIEFQSGQQYDPEILSVEVEMQDLPQIGDLIRVAVEEVLRRSERSGVRFSLSEENCDLALALARQEAITLVERDSGDLADAVGVVRSGIIGAVEYSANSFGPPRPDKCGGGQFHPYETQLMPFDAEPEIEVSLQMLITYGPASHEAGGLTVTASSSRAVTADEAYVVVIPEQFYGPTGPVPLSSDDRADVIEQLTQIGIDTDDVEFISGRQPYEPVQISVEVMVEDLPEVGERILDAVEDVIRRSQLSGVRFSLLEASCDAALAVERRDAALQAERNADDLAEALGVVRGGVIGVVEYLLSSFSEGPLSSDRCGGQFQDPYALMPFDAEPKTDVSVQLQVTYAPQSDEAGGLTVTAVGSRAVTSDEAYVVVIPEQFYGPTGPVPLSSEDRADVIEKLTQIGIDTDDIEIISGRQRFEPAQISVEVKVEDLPEVGERILDAVEDVIRRSQLSGVRFSLPEENCDRALALERQEAALQAERNADDLAEALGVVRGGLIGVVEYPASSFGYGPLSSDRCGGQFQEPYALLPFDAEPKIDVSLQMLITYATE